MSLIMDEPDPAPETWPATPVDLSPDFLANVNLDHEIDTLISDLRAIRNRKVLVMDYNATVRAEKLISLACLLCTYHQWIHELCYDHRETAALIGEDLWAG